jgi:hypothetical protein
MTSNQKIAVLGDVHGKSEQLKELIKKIRSVHPDIEIYSLGDLIDRGQDSKGVIQVCMDEGVHAIIGNHDQWLQDLVARHQFDPFCIKPIMGGKATLESFGVDHSSDGINYFPKGRPPADIAMELFAAVPKEQIKWLSSLPAFRKIDAEGETFWLLHAGLTRAVANKFRVKTVSPITYYNDDDMMDGIINTVQGLNSILWTTPNFGGYGTQDNLYAFEDGVQVFGHRPHKKPIIKGHYIAMDTGCGTCEPFTLSAIILPDRDIISVKEEF